jgi:nucleoside-diphosphate-sugar epimerase
MDQIEVSPAAGTHVVAGGGSVGSPLASLLADAGADVVVVTRSGLTPVDPRIRRLALDIADTETLLRAIPSAAAIYNCVNPPYHRWAAQWPPLARSFESYAERTGAVLVTCSNLYGYGPVEVPMTESLPLAATGTNGHVRAEMWRDAKALHDAGRIRATEVRGSDYIASSAQSRLGARVIPRIVAGKAVQLPGDLDQPHSWTAPRDVARLMVIAGTDERAWGRAWHAPSNPPRTQREAVTDLATAAGVSSVKISSVPRALLWALGIVNPTIRGLRETGYQMERPYILDDTAARHTFAMQPTPWDDIVRATVAPFLPTPSPATTGESRRVRL